jgi:hypothetical protein
VIERMIKVTLLFHRAMMMMVVAVVYYPTWFLRFSPSFGDEWLDPVLSFVDALPMIPMHNQFAVVEKRISWRGYELSIPTRGVLNSLVLGLFLSVTFPVEMPEYTAKR